MKTATLTLPAGLPVKLSLAMAAIILALLAMPGIGHAQGIVRGAQVGAAFLLALSSSTGTRF